MSHVSYPEAGERGCGVWACVLSSASLLLPWQCGRRGGALVGSLGSSKDSQGFSFLTQSFAHQAAQIPPQEPQCHQLKSNNKAPGFWIEIFIFSVCFALFPCLFCKRYET